MKNIILSIIIVAVIAIGGFFLFQGKPSGEASNVQIKLNGYNNTNDSVSATTTNNTNVATNDTGALEKPTTNTTTTNKKTHMVTIETNYGKIVFETYDSDAPNTVKNFVTLAGK